MNGEVVLFRSLCKLDCILLVCKKFNKYETRPNSDQTKLKKVSVLSIINPEPPQEMLETKEMYFIAGLWPVNWDCFGS